MTPQGFDLGVRRHPRRMSLTAMIDVVFLLLIFFMLASRFGADAVLPIVTGTGGGAASEWQGAPRLIDVGPEGVALNGAQMADADLATALRPLLPHPDALVILRAQDGADVQRLVDVIDLMKTQQLGLPVLAE
ncbi:ExbD/TolR family protein [Paracoccus tegillarcae]|uniref:Biopolymer transporter ExbD n=1 Tax=Paracoccus tegillarcae TaxID=1529068 RepID=A0A2K9EMH3_9RHOB|nr:biopolymer transporter ExbD [Paracoccus tegillarcae]AUH32815.1 biopolymer transporter ExbD [Paracoccus tegillarcae]